MSRSVPILALGIVFAVAGIALFAFTMRQREKLEATEPKRKSDARDLEVEKKNNAKMRIAAGVIAVFGAALVLIS